jgi:hypothetical protein
VEQFVSDIARGVAGSAGGALEAFNAFFFALLMAAPAVAWMAYLPVERWFGIVGRSHVAGIIAGTSLALLASLCFAMLSRFLQGWIVSGYRWELYAPYAALVLVLVAIGVQLSASVKLLVAAGGRACCCGIDALSPGSVDETHVTGCDRAGLALYRHKSFKRAT